MKRTDVGDVDDAGRGLLEQVHRDALVRRQLQRALVWHLRSGGQCSLDISQLCDTPAMSCDHFAVICYSVTARIRLRRDCICKQGAARLAEDRVHTLSSCVGGVSGLFSVAATPPSRLNRPPNSGSAYAVLGLAKTTATANASVPTQDASALCHWGRGSAASCAWEFTCQCGASGGGTPVDQSDCCDKKASSG